MKNRIIRLHDCPPRPWKNGLGRTREIAVQPSADDSEDFLWRVSIAEVDSAAPFSRFPGIDRQIVLLDGDGFTMTLDDERTHALTTPFAPFAFPGEAKVEVALAGGPTRDFNLMLCRARVRGAIDSPDGTLQAGDAWRPPLDAAAPVLHPGALALAVRIKAIV
jgi:environmental stress-induced protein Ves